MFFFLILTNYWRWSDWTRHQNWGDERNATEELCRRLFEAKELKRRIISEHGGFLVVKERSRNSSSSSSWFDTVTQKRWRRCREMVLACSSPWTWRMGGERNEIPDRIRSWRYCEVRIDIGVQLQQKVGRNGGDHNEIVVDSIELRNLEGWKIRNWATQGL